MKVLKGKNEKQNWVYGAKPNATVKDVAASVGGQEVTSQCIVEVNKSLAEGGCEDKNESDTSQTSTPSHIISALIPGPNAGTLPFTGTEHCLTSLLDFSKIVGVGQFVSVDGRPITTARGFGKGLCKLFKTYLCGAATKSGSNGITTDPFICIHIGCPPSSYDINVEPAKDDVLFAADTSVWKEIEDLFKHVYGDLQPDEKTNGAFAGRKTNRSAASGSGFDLLLARTPAQRLPLTVGQTRTDIQDGASEPEVTSEDLNAHMTEVGGELKLSSTSNQLGRRNMATVTEEDLELIADDQDESELSDIDESEISRPTVTNPWSLAKLHAPISYSRLPLGSDGQPQNHRVAAQGSPTLSPIPNTRATHIGPALNPSPLLPSPAKSPSPPFYQNPGPPKRPWKVPRPSEGENIFTQQDNRRVSRPSALDAWIKSSSSPSPMFQASENSSAVSTTMGRFAPPCTSPARKNQARRDEEIIDALQTPAASDIGSPLNGEPDGIRKPFRQPFMSPVKFSSGSIRDATAVKGFSQTIITPRSSAVEGSDTPDHHSLSPTELEEIMEFEHRKKVAQQTQRQARLAKLQQSTLALSGTSNESCYEDDDTAQLAQKNQKHPAQSPHHNRYLAAKSALTGQAKPSPKPLARVSTGTVEDLQSSTNQIIDPGHSLVTKSNTNLLRTKSSVLSLESTSKKSSLHSLCTRFSVPASPHSGSTSTTSWSDLLAPYTQSTSKPDKYITASGYCSASSEHISLLWSEGDVAASTKEMEAWEARLKELVKCSRSECNGEEAELGQEIQVQFNLLRCLKAFVASLADTESGSESTE